MKITKVGSAEFYQGDCISVLRKLPEASFQCCVTSPPYYGLRVYDGDATKEIGREPTLNEYVANLVEVGRGVRRVLRDDGVFWLNLGDSFCNTDKWGGGKNNNTGKHTADGNDVPSWKSTRIKKQKQAGFKPKDMMLVPFHVAMALQADGWWLRACLPWLKRNAMPTSANDRPGTSVEYVFMLTKSPTYFFDMVSVRKQGDPYSPRTIGGAHHLKEKAAAFGLVEFSGNQTSGKIDDFPAGCNFRDSDLWFESLESTTYGAIGSGNELLGLDINVGSLAIKHFAAYPTKLIAPLLKCSTSPKGCCPKCGAPWKRVLEKERRATRPASDSKVTKQRKVAGAPGRSPVGATSCFATTVGNRDPQRHVTETKTLGWEPTCVCGDLEPIPCKILDPFGGAGTTALVGRKLGLDSVSIELNPEYIELAAKRVKSGGAFGTWRDKRSESEKARTDGLFSKLGVQ